MKKSVLDQAQELLATVEAALPCVEGLCGTVREWNGSEPPPLLRSSASWRDAMKGNEKKLEQFESLVYFLTEAIFGVDCDHDSVVTTRFIDRSRYQHRHPPFRIPRLPDKPTFKEIMRARELAQTNVDAARETLRHIEVELKFFMEDNPELFEESTNDEA